MLVRYHLLALDSTVKCAGGMQTSMHTPLKPQVTKAYYKYFMDLKLSCQCLFFSFEKLQ